MKKLIFILMFLNIPFAFSDSCITDEEYPRIVDSLESINEYYGAVKTAINCKENTLATQIICSDDRLNTAVILLSKASVFAYENATHTPVEDLDEDVEQTKDRLESIAKTAPNKEMAKRKLCYAVKVYLGNYLGGDFELATSDITHEIMESETNKNGFVITTMESRIYLGKSCDAIYATDKGDWYYQDGEFIVTTYGGRFKNRIRNDGSLSVTNCIKDKKTTFIFDDIDMAISFWKKLSDFSF